MSINKEYLKEMIAQVMKERHISVPGGNDAIAPPEMRSIEDTPDSMDKTGDRNYVETKVYTDYGQAFSDFMRENGDMVKHHNLQEELFAEVVRQAKIHLELE